MENKFEMTLTENSYIFQSALRLANRALNEGIKLLLDNEDKWQDSYNLKLHDAFGTCVDFELNGAKVCFDDSEADDWFYRFCDSEFDCFKEWMSEEHINTDILDYIGRTSSFHIGKLHASMLSDTIVEASDTYGRGFYAWKLNEETKEFETDVEDISKYCEDLEEVVNTMLEFAENFVDEVKDSLEDIIKVHTYITEFKENQVENFKEYVKECWVANI